jgi:hypothetical protein
MLYTGLLHGRAFVSYIEGKFFEVVAVLGCPAIRLQAWLQYILVAVQQAASLLPLKATTVSAQSTYL